MRKIIHVVVPLSRIGCAHLRRRRLALLLLCPLVAGCTVGPDFAPPVIPQLSTLGAEATKRTNASPGPQRWWELFGCPALNALVERALLANPDLDAAKAALRVAEANAAAIRGGQLPHVEASIGGTRTISSAASVGTGAKLSPYSVASGQLSVSYAFDVFGGGRRRVESAEARSEMQRYELEAAHLTLTSKLVLAAVAEAAAYDEMQAARTSLAVGKEVLDILRRQVDAHEATQIELVAQDVAVIEFERALQRIERRLALNRNQLAALTGELTTASLKEKFDFTCVRLPRVLPTALPSAIVRNRPDLRAAEARVHIATAEVGVALANRLPQFTLSASSGVNTAAALLAASPAAVLWSLSGSAAHLLFDGMALEQRQRAAEAGLDESLALYHSTVVKAFQSVADVLRGLEYDRKAQTLAERGVRTSKSNLDLTRKLLKQNLATANQALSAQQQFAQANTARIQAKSDLYGSAVLLYQALGGRAAIETADASPWTVQVKSGPDVANRAPPSGPRP